MWVTAGGLCFKKKERGRAGKAKITNQIVILARRGEREREKKNDMSNIAVEIPSKQCFFPSF